MTRPEFITVRREDLERLVEDTFDRTPWIHEVDHIISELTAGVPQIDELQRWDVVNTAFDEDPNDMDGVTFVD